jgi:hypothetical protein
MNHTVDAADSSRDTPVATLLMLHSATWHLHGHIPCKVPAVQPVLLLAAASPWLLGLSEQLPARQCLW